MGTRIIMQSNGLYGLFSTVTDRIVAYNCTEEDLVQIEREYHANEAERRTRDWLRRIRDGEPRPARSTLTMAEAFERHEFQNAGSDRDRAFDVELRKFTGTDLTGIQSDDA